MCGIAGILDNSGRLPLEAVTRSMTAALSHRGPDGGGIWLDSAAGLALGHRRLAVVELSELGAQPMHSTDGRYVVVFNGEIYNYRELRKQLRARYAFAGSSDTEVLLAAISEWGLERALSAFNGMFAFAIWDRRERKLYLARDRAGEKPLYYGRLRDSFVFASELCALAAHPAAPGDIDHGALGEYLHFGYVPSPRSIYSGIHKLPPGHWLEVNARGIVSCPRSYWSAESAVIEAHAEPFRLSEQDAVGQLDELLSDAVRLETSADVPVGAFLSGGIDSSTVVALMCRHERRVRTFTIGFDEPEYDESPYARAVARHLGTEHTDYQLSSADAMAVIPKLSAIYSEPFSDASQIPTYLISELARRHVTVALSGDGADELFGGYNRYFWADSIWRSIRPLPHWARRALSRGLSAAPVTAIDRMARAIAPLLPARGRLRNPGDKLHKIAHIVSARDAGEVYRRLVTNWPEPLLAADGPAVPTWPANEHLDLPFPSRMMLLDTMTYLPDDILVKVDRASMANSLEVRAPFLDRRVMKFAARLPIEFKVRNGSGKWLLRRLLQKYIPPALFERPKAGFAIPLDRWVRGPLREWVEELLSERRLRGEGLFRPAAVRHKWREHLSGARNWIAPLWSVLMFQAWNEQRRRPAASPAVMEIRVATS
jgi:asparagine synthase (glutamine-hydrolysing)